jgi:DNA-directed RNA polymerase subunit RPC12/RpoP
MTDPRVYRTGVRFDCPTCGKLLRDCTDHRGELEPRCSDCGGKLLMVAWGANAALVGDAKWYRCEDCGCLYMQRRGEVAKTGSRAGFDEFT